MNLQELIDWHRAGASDTTAIGDVFERMVKVYFENDDMTAPFYDRVLPWAEWARENGRLETDIGIDLVAVRKGGESGVAVQCKCVAADTTVSKREIDSFATAVAGEPSLGGMILATTSEKELSDNARYALARNPKWEGVLRLPQMAESRIDWDKFLKSGKVAKEPGRKPWPHQAKALEDIAEGFKAHDRGKVIMACGTGKTLVALRAAEKQVGKGGSVLVMVPSLALMAQMVRAWSNDAQIPLNSHAVCSDTGVGRIRADRDSIDLTRHDLAFPSTTDAGTLAARFALDSGRMTVVFSTYHSIGVIAKAQQEHDLPEFDLVVCDEAHRTTGAMLAGKEESAWVKIHSDDNISARKRMYMTATPRVYRESAKAKASEADATLWSMDDMEMYGPEFHRLTFGAAVDRELLADYKVVVMTVSEELAVKLPPSLLGGGDMDVGTVAKMIGCCKALSKRGYGKFKKDEPPMGTAIAFCNTIANSKVLENQFGRVAKIWRDEVRTRRNYDIDIAAKHVDGTFGAAQRAAALDWLRGGDGDDAKSRVLSNAKLLTEGVDVPALDAILFMHPRESYVEVVQAVGRVMRRDPSGRDKIGYVILPVVVPPGKTPEQALDKNKSFRVIWQVLNALRSHDDRLDAQLNRGALGGRPDDHVVIAGMDGETEFPLSPKGDNMTAYADFGGGRRGEGDPAIGKGPVADDGTGVGEAAQEQYGLFDEESIRNDFWADLVLPVIAEKCGSLDYWDDWAEEAGRVAKTVTARVKAAVERPHTRERGEFNRFLGELRKNLNPGVTEDAAVEMLAQHMITRPIFDALFAGSRFADSNPVSVGMGKVLAKLNRHGIESEMKGLAGFYERVKRQVAGISTTAEKQALVKKVYDKFFAKAFKKTREKLGIVYTPVEIVDFIVRSVNDVLEDEFGTSLADPNVNILDPFAGTGTFVTRLMQSGLIPPEALERKYQASIFCTEIVLLAYYIAAINIETVFHDIMEEAGRGVDYVPYRRIVLADTFQMHENRAEYRKGNRGLFQSDDDLKENARVQEEQMDAPIDVIVGNPPYSVGQRNSMDNAQNERYPELDARIEETYAARSNATLRRNVYDSYIRAIRWATDRLDGKGVIAFISNSGWLDGNAMDGMRKCLAEEFSSLYIFDLRGNIRKGMMNSEAAEGGNVFGSGTQTGVAVFLLVKNPDAEKHGVIRYHDIGNDLSTREKIGRVAELKSIRGIAEKGGWNVIVPNGQGDWLNQRDVSFQEYISMGERKIGGNVSAEGIPVFEIRSLGVATNRDTWVVNSCQNELEMAVRASIEVYEDVRERFHRAKADGEIKGNVNDVDMFIDYIGKEMKWTRGSKQDIRRNSPLAFGEDSIVPSVYRPFTARWIYFDGILNETRYQMPDIFPHAGAENRVIQVSGVGARTGFSALMSNRLVDLSNIESGQNFPLHIYEEAHHAGGGGGGYTRRDGITDDALGYFRSAYGGKGIGKIDIFNYIYGILHSPEYRKRFASNLVKQVPRIPLVESWDDFIKFRDAGAMLGEMHMNFDDVDPYPVTYEKGEENYGEETERENYYRVTKMRHPGAGKKKDLTRVIYNGNITVSDIPPEAYEYKVSGHSALWWVMNRQVVDPRQGKKESGIKDDANRYAIDTMGDPRYPLMLLRRVITISMETLAIVKGLPELKIKDAPVPGR